MLTITLSRPRLVILAVSLNLRFVVPEAMHKESLQALKGRLFSSKIAHKTLIPKVEGVHMSFTLKLNVNFRELKKEGHFHYKNFLRALK